MRIVRLGEGVDRTGRLSAAALDRTMIALREYAGLIAETKSPAWGSPLASGAPTPDHPRRPPFPPGAIRMVATSATRDAENSQEFTDRVIDVLGVAPEVISGDEEARLSFTGATRELAGAPLGAGGGCPPPYLVTDIGGGSTEFILGGPEAAGAGGEISGRSVNIGCVRMTERHLHGDPPLDGEVADTIADIDAALDQAAAASVPVTIGGAGAVGTLVGLAGSVTTVAAIALGLDHYDSARIHHSRVSAARVHGDRRRTAGP